MPSVYTSGVLGRADLNPAGQADRLRASPSTNPPFPPRGTCSPRSWAPYAPQTVVYAVWRPAEAAEATEKEEEEERLSSLMFFL